MQRKTFKKKTSRWCLMVLVLTAVVPVCFWVAYSTFHFATGSKSKLTYRRLLNLNEDMAIDYAEKGMVRGEMATSEFKALDGWGNPILIECTNNVPFRLISLGKDGMPGGEGDATDLFLILNFENKFMTFDDVKPLFRTAE